MAKTAVKEKKSKKRPTREAYCFKCQEMHELKSYEVVRLKSGRKQVRGVPKNCPNKAEALYGFVSNDVPHDRDQTEAEAEAAAAKRKSKKEAFIGKTKSDDKAKKSKKSKKDDEDEKPEKKSKKSKDKKKSKEEKPEKTKKKSKKDKADKTEKKAKKKSKK